jgi:hypothetical protein
MLFRVRTDSEKPTMRKNKAGTCDQEGRRVQRLEDSRGRSGSTDRSSMRMADGERHVCSLSILIFIIIMGLAPEADMLVGDPRGGAVTVWMLSRVFSSGQGFKCRDVMRC